MKAILIMAGVDIRAGETQFYTKRTGRNAPHPARYTKPGKIVCWGYCKGGVKVWLGSVWGSRFVQEELYYDKLLAKANTLVGTEIEYTTSEDGKFNFAVTPIKRKDLVARTVKEGL